MRPCPPSFTHSPLTWRCAPVFLRGSYPPQPTLILSYLNGYSFMSLRCSPGKVPAHAGATKRWMDKRLREWYSWYVVCTSYDAISHGRCQAMGFRCGASCADERSRDLLIRANCHRGLSSRIVVIVVCAADRRDRAGPGRKSLYMEGATMECTLQGARLVDSMRDQQRADLVIAGPRIRADRKSVV